MKLIETTIYLLPGVLSRAQVLEIFRLCLSTYRWFVPARYGRGEAEIHIEPKDATPEFLAARYSEWGDIIIAPRRRREQFLVISPSNEMWAAAYYGHISWYTPLKVSPKWRTAHLDQVATLMRMVSSPLALCGVDEDFDKKLWRTIKDPELGGSMMTTTVPGYEKGLAGIYWRNFYGSMFIRLFGDRLTSLPKEYTRDLGGDLWLVEPYELPDMAGTPEAQARERAIIEHLGPECFYDHERHIMPTRVPELPPVPPSSGALWRPPPGEPQNEVERVLAEYWDWAAREWEQAGVMYRKTDRGYLLLTSPTTDRAKAVLDWAYANLDNPLLLMRTPKQVADYLQAKSNALAQPSPVDPRPELARIREALGPTAFEALLNLIPTMGDIEAALRSFAKDDPEAQELLPRVRGLRQLAELLSFVPLKR